MRRAVWLTKISVYTNGEVSDDRHVGFLDLFPQLRVVLKNFLCTNKPIMTIKTMVYRLCENIAALRKNHGVRLKRNILPLIFIIIPVIVLLWPEELYIPKKVPFLEFVPKWRQNKLDKCRSVQHPLKTISCERFVHRILTNVLLWIRSVMVSFYIWY